LSVAQQDEEGRIRTFLSTKTQCALLNRGWKRDVESLRHIPEDELMRLPGFGRNSLAQVRALLSEHHVVERRSVDELRVMFAKASAEAEDLERQVREEKGRLSVIRVALSVAESDSQPKQ